MVENPSVNMDFWGNFPESLNFPLTLGQSKSEPKEPLFNKRR